MGSPIPGLNRLMLGDSDQRIDEGDLEAVLDRLAALPALSAWVPVGGTAFDLIATRLREHGFRVDPAEPDVPAMLSSLAALPPLEPPPGVTLRRADTHDDVELGNRVLADAFGAPPALGHVLTEAFGDAVLEPLGTMWMDLAEVDGKPVATAHGSVVDDVLGVYSVATLPAWRGRGLGRQVTLASMHEGAHRGASTATLESTEIAYPVYRRVGFEETGRYRVLVR